MNVLPWQDRAAIPILLPGTPGSKVILDGGFKETEAQGVDVRGQPGPKVALD